MEKSVTNNLETEKIMITESYHPNECKKGIPKGDITPHILLLHLFDKYAEKTYRAIIEQSPFHKLSYKFTEEQIA